MIRWVKWYIRWFRRERALKRVMKAQILLNDFDNYMKRAGYSRQERRRIWREFAKNKDLIFNRLKDAVSRA
jgi:hypothetical protein